VQDTVLRYPWIWRTIADWFSDRMIGPRRRIRRETSSVEALNGVCVLVRSACIAQIGALDESMFGYIEDVEFADRCRDNGWHIEYVPVDSIIHMQKPAGYELDGAVSFLLKRNTAYFLSRSGHAVQALLYMVFSLTLCLVRSLGSLARGRLTQCWSFLRFGAMLARCYSFMLWPGTRARAMGPPPASLVTRRNVKTRRSRVGSARVCIVTQVRTPYREPLFQKLSDDHRVELKVFYFADSLPGVAWPQGTGPTDNHAGYEHETLPNMTPRWLRWLPVVSFSSVSIVRRLAAERPDYVIVYGYNFLTQLLAIGYCWWTGTPYALRSDSNGFVERTRGLKHRLKRLLLGPIIRSADALLCVGSANRRYWEIYGAAPGQLRDAAYAVDNDWLRAECERQREHAAAIRRELGWDDKCVFLFSGRLAREKGVDILVEAMNRVCARRDDVRLAVVGAGRLREKLIGQLNQTAANCTHFFGQAAYADMPRNYALADALVLPSRHEPWGLVINEAMACGLTVVATDCCGAARDLVVPGRTGLVLHEPTAEELADALVSLANDADVRRAMGRAGAAHVRQWNFDRTLRGFLDAITGTTKLSRAEAA
jgi:glycosyltransferase involved in cell wall biosynthesis